jgi:hypothetical protein
LAALPGFNQDMSVVDKTTPTRSHALNLVSRNTDPALNRIRRDIAAWTDAEKLANLPPDRSNLPIAGAVAPTHAAFANEPRNAGTIFISSQQSRF